MCRPPFSIFREMITMDNSIKFYKKHLADIETEMGWCRLDMDSGIDYDYSQDRLDELDRLQKETRLDYFSYRRRSGL